MPRVGWVKESCGLWRACQIVLEKLYSQCTLKMTSLTTEAFRAMTMQFNITIMMVLWAHSDSWLHLRQLLCISTSFWVGPAPKNWSKHFFQLFFTEKALKWTKKVEKRLKKRFQPAFGYAQLPKAGRNTQQTACLKGRQALMLLYRHHPSQKNNIPKRCFSVVPPGFPFVT